ncbi:MAG: asparagine synthase (glutamine-hydrolyzing) [Chloroflexota bacterium]
MCGIAGFVAESRADESADILERMCATLIPRGPDSQGTLLRPGVALGMRRLSIIDLAGGDQPLYNEDESVAVVCNGEIYNSPDLRARLEQAGHRFRTHSDCEVVAHGYEEWGPECVQHLNGMFAFALWDDRQKLLMLARDRAGIKPLHYANVDGGIAFGSEIKALLRHPGVGRELDFDALADYLSFEYVPTPASIFRRIRKLPPGHYLTYRPGEAPRFHQYWDWHLADSGARGSASPVETARELRTVLEEAVRTELISDVPVGVLLSGGIDSSTVAALMARQSSSTVHSFSIGFDDPSFDESRYARLVAERVGTEHHELVLRPKDMWELVPKVTDFLDEPMGDSSIIPTYLLAGFVRESAKVVLGGDGGDEVFAGYPTLQAHQAARYFRHLPGGVTSLLDWTVNRMPVSHDNISLDFKIKRFVAGLGQDQVARHHLWLGSVPGDQARRLLAPGVRSELGSGRPYGRAYQHLEQCSSQEELNQILYADFKLYLENDILVKVDRASMARGLEVRVPLLNQAVIEHAARISPRLKLRGMTGKYILKEAVKDLLPAEIIHRKKKGFNMPVARWFSGELKPLLLDTLNPSRIRQDGLFDEFQVRTLLEDHFAQRRDNRKPLWTLFIFQQWYDRYLRVPVPTELPAGQVA